MASLADELLADMDAGPDRDEGSDGELEASFAGGSGASNGVDKGKRKAENILDDANLDEEMEEEERSEEEDGGEGADGREKKEAFMTKNAVRPAEELNEEDVQAMELWNVQDVGSVSKVAGSKRLTEVMNQIDHYSSLSEPDMAGGVLEESPEYKLIVAANNLAVDVDNDIMIIHKFIRDHYSPKFPELETLISNPWEYVRAVKALGNEADMSKVPLEGILPHGTVVVISMTASTTNGKPLSEGEWKTTEMACNLVVDLENTRRKILEYVESRMSYLAPNLSAIVGTRTATKLLGVAGGLTGLSKMPADNIFLLGAQKKAVTGLISAQPARRVGFIYQSELVQSQPEEFRQKGQRMVAAKCVLAARMDLLHQYRDGSYGQKLKAELDKRFEKLAEPPPPKLVKALPVPDEGPKKRRGGKRVRKAKEAYGMTELRKLQNRMAFGEPEEETGALDETRGLGMIGSASGRLRAGMGEARSKAKMSKMNKNRLAQLRVASSSRSGTATAGTASSLAFTPVQGIELVDPSRQQQQKVADANAKWFQQGQFSFVPSAPKGTKELPGSRPPVPRFPEGGSGSGSGK